MSDISKAKHVASNKQARGKHAKHASTDNLAHPSRLRYAAGTFLISSAIALGLFALQPFYASESINLEESRTTSAGQNALVIKSARVMHANIEESLQSYSLDEPQSTDESLDPDDSSVSSDEYVQEEQTTDEGMQTDSSREIEATEDDQVSNATASDTEQQDNFDSEDDSATVSDPSNPMGSEESTDTSDNASIDAQEVGPRSESQLNTESNDETNIDSNSPASMISSKVNYLDPENLEADIAFFNSVLENGSPISEDDAQKLAEEPVYYSSVVEPQLQHGVLDSGCEIVSLSMALESMDIKADPVEIADGYLDLEGGMTDGFVGSPYDGGAGFPAGIAKAANAYLQDIKSEHRAYDLTGNSFDTIAGLVSHGYPVLIWTTIDFTEPFFHDVYEGDYRWYGNEHCVLLCGISDDTVLVCDPLEGLIERDAEQFIQIFEQCGSMALYVR